MLLCSLPPRHLHSLHDGFVVIPLGAELFEAYLRNSDKFFEGLGGSGFQKFASSLDIFFNYHIYVHIRKHCNPDQGDSEEYPASFLQISFVMCRFPKLKSIILFTCNVGVSKDYGLLLGGPDNKNECMQICICIYIYIQRHVGDLGGTTSFGDAHLQVHNFHNCPTRVSAAQTFNMRYRSLKLCFWVLLCKDLSAGT